ncbi:MAG: OmpP1/FadL family transporter [Thiobacillus sp.]
MKLSRITLALAIAGLSVGAHATNGYFSHGYGMKAKGMAGASTTNTEDAFFGANNPAAAAFAGNRLDLGVDLFSPIRKASRTGSAFSFTAATPGGGTATISGSFDGSSKSDSNYFLIPEFGYNKMINPNLALGVTVYGNGGMNTNYPGGQIPAGTCGPGAPASNLLCGSGRLGVDLMQLIVAPTVAFKVAPDHAIGISPLLGYQRFKAEGLQGFGVSNSSGGNLGYDDSFGYGVRVGYLGKLAPTVTIGAAYASKMKMEAFDKYRRLFAERGDFDMPENWNVGVSWQASPALRLALDYQRINYSDVKSVGNMVSSPGSLGDPNGPGFGWDDISIWKLGMEYKYSPKLTLRAGYSHTDSPIKGSDCSSGPLTNCGEVMFNILAPAVIENHVTLGFTYTLASGNELSMAYMHAFKNDVSGRDPIFGGDDKIEMYQNAIGIQYSWKM